MVVIIIDINKYVMFYVDHYVSKYILHILYSKRVHTEKYFLNLVNPNQIWIVITIFR